ncbi:hypothetical protein PR202_ga22097 [Eleusine coracana subsp. coracana]|uniref:Uncharacterized protein n=1 Tax=Eleusine coracana subsp. coracana TaxID=191504 RepID=A0AAV5D1P3_ELECO|nr:hypothetical protein PR202_ga22097 [Eleusine coracana subsp. coracana]
MVTAVSVHASLALVTAGARGATLARLLAFLGAPSVKELAEFGSNVTHRVIAMETLVACRQGDMAILSNAFTISSTIPLSSVNNVAPLHGTISLIGSAAFTPCQATLLEGPQRARAPEVAEVIVLR